MSKRPYFPQNGGDRKKAKLDVTVSDHNFPLSQNSTNREPEKDNWGDENDDEILLLASQACEDAYNDLSSLPDYSICMQPRSTSTQLFDPGPSTSKANFSFKKPSAMPPSSITSNLKDKCNRISSPLPGISSKVLPKATEHINLADDLIFNDKIYKHQDTDVVYKQLLQLQEENAKLKSENGKLLEKCVTKEGEASILRTQLKTYQVSVDNARMEKIKAQEKMQIEWTEKLNKVNNQIHDLRTQLDFKNLEIISIKERCKLLESNKVKLTQVTVANNDITSSQRMNNSFSMKDHMGTTVRKPKLTSNSAQTDDKAHFLKLNLTCRTEPSPLTEILPLILEPTTSQHSLLEYNEKLQKHTDLSQNKCRVFSTFHRIPTSSGIREYKGEAVSMGRMYEDLTSIAAGTDDGNSFGNLLSLFKRVLEEVSFQLELVSRKVTTAFQKEMDEKYIDASSTYLVATQRDLLCGKPLYKEEQAILARRMTCVLAIIVKKCTNVRNLKQQNNETSQIAELIQKICNLLDSTSCALLYSGFLLSTTNIINYLQEDKPKCIELVKTMISSRTMPFVSCQLLKLTGIILLNNNLLEQLCTGHSTGNLRMDYDQGVLLYKKDSCCLQVLLKQVETSLKCIEKQSLTEQAIDTSTDLLALYGNINKCSHVVRTCDCQLILLQVIVYALRICAVMLKTLRAYIDAVDPTSTRLLAVCRSGTHILYRCTLRDVEFCSQLGHYEGLLVEFCEIVKDFEHSEVYVNMMSELSSTFQSSPEDCSAAFQSAPWTRSFQNFTIAD